MRHERLNSEHARAYARARANDAAPWITPLARLGYAAKGVVFVLLGALALQAAAGAGGATTDSRGVLRTIGASAFGSVALALIGVGLLGYMLWQLLVAATDAEGKGRGAKGVALRLGQVGRAAAYGALGVEALRLLVSARGREGDAAEHWTARLLAVPYGRWLVAAAGAGVVCYALYQLYVAVSGRVRKHLDLARATRRAAAAVVWFGRVGVAARAVVFAVIGWLLVRAALHHAPQEAGGIDASLATLAARPHGRLLLAAVAAGLVAYGLFQLATARYRRMRVS